MLELVTILLQGPVTTVQQQANWTSVVMAGVVALPATIAAIVSGMALFQSRHNAEVAAKTDKKSDVIIEKATEIHTLTNSNLAKVTAQLEAANQKLEQSDSRMRRLEDMVTRLTPGAQDANSSKLDQLGKDLAANTATGDRIEAGNISVAEDLDAAHKRAGQAESSEPGAAADAAAVKPE